MAETRAPARTISLEEFWTDPSVPEHSEWVRGEVETMSPVSNDHSRLCVFLNGMLREFCQHRCPGEVRAEPFQVFLPPSQSSRAPDCMVILAEHAERIRHTHVEAPVDLVIEVLSPESRGRDRGEKYYEYEEAGIAEYWLIDPARRTADFSCLERDGRYQTVLPVDGRFTSRAIPGLWIELDWLWSQPSILVPLRAWGLLA